MINFHNWTFDVHKWIVDLHNWIMDIFDIIMDINIRIWGLFTFSHAYQINS